jgi:hypothetical protein
MAKKLALLILLAVLVAPVALAQVASCTLGRNILYGGVRYLKGHTIYDPESAPAGTGDCPTSGDTTGDCMTKEWGTVCLLNSIYNVTDWISFILLAVAAIMIIMGAFTLATAAGAPEKVTAGRNYIIFAVVGIVVALLSRAIPAIARRFVGA